MGHLSISLFGRFNAEIDHETVEGLKPNKLQYLLSYLLLHRDRQHHREHLAEQFWESNSTVQSKKYLRHNLWKLRQSLELCTDGESELLVVDGVWVSINNDAQYWLDVKVFEDAYKTVQKTPAHDINLEDATTMKQVLPLYKGELLEGWYQDWCQFERERFQQIYLFMLDKLMCYCEAHSEYEEGIHYGNLSLRQDQALELTHRRLMSLYYLSGNRTAALRQYQSCLGTLREQLSVEPSSLTQSLFGQIEADELLNDTMSSDSAKQQGIQVLLDKLSNQLRQVQLELNRFKYRGDTQITAHNNDS